MGDFTLDDFRKQFEQLKKMGPMKDILASMPGMAHRAADAEESARELRRIQGILDAITKGERKVPEIIDRSRRRRIARGSGTGPHEVRRFLIQFLQVREMMRRMP